jgi:hypothetical protein
MTLFLLGALKGKINISKEFNAPLPEKRLNGSLPAGTIAA